MKRKVITLLSILLVLLAPQSSFKAAAQGNAKRVISGRVTDNSTGESIPGASVMIEGTLIGVITDTDGKYSIPVSGNGTLKFDCLGYESLSLKMPTTGDVLDAKLAPDTTTLDEVVVTALGITRKEKSLGYSVSKLTSDELLSPGAGNWLSGAAGKVAGLNIDQGAGPDGTLRVVLRGENSLSYDNNTALFVVDGVPVNTTSFSNADGGSYQNDDAPIDYGGGSIDVNPDDIESMTVLKGPAATALYGSRAANGAIVITTKSSDRSKGVGVTYNGGVTFDVPGFWPNIQTEYGVGDFRASTLATHMSDGITPDEYSYYTVPADLSDTGEKILNNHSRYQFGEKVVGQYRYMYSSYDLENGTFTRKPYEVHNLIKDFFNTGATYSNSVTVDGGDGKGSMIRASIKDLRNKYISPNTGFDAQTFSIKGTSKRGKVLDVAVTATYYTKHSDNLPMNGYNDTSIMKSLMWVDAGSTIQDVYDEYASGRLETFRAGDEEGKIISGSQDNPYFISYAFLNTMKREKAFGNATLTFHIVPGLDFMLRGAMNLQNDFRTQRRPQYARQSMRGMYKEQTTSFLETNADALLSYNHKFRGGFQLDASMGGNLMHQSKSNIKLYAAQLLEPNVFIVQNVNGVLSVTNYREEKAINSAYGFLSGSYKDMVFLEVTGRNDWSSTLAKGHNSYFYPSVNTSILLDKVFGIGKKARWVDMIKFFTTWANVGNDTKPYNIMSTYNNSADFTGAYSIPTVTTDYYLKPENVESFEIGLETSFFKKRVAFNATYYNTETTNQIINLPQDWASGASASLINAGCVRNRGVELSAHFMPVDHKDFKWTIDVNWAHNKNTLVELAPGVTNWQISSLLSSKVFVYAVPGGDMGRIYGPGIEKAPAGAYYVDENGQKVLCEGMDIVNKETGNPVRNSDMKDLGSVYPDWTGGLQTELKYKWLTLSASFSASCGGKAYSLTNAILSYMGKTTSTLPGRYGGLVHEGVNLNPDGTYSKNTTITTDIVEYYNLYVYNRDNIEMNVFDTSFLKLKELRLSFAVPKKIMKKVKVFQSFSASVFATNVFCLTNWPQFDPEVSAMSGSSLYKGVETGALPMCRTYGMNIKVGF